MHQWLLYAAQAFSRAAEECLVSQSTLSAGLRELESLIGVTLILGGVQILFIGLIGQYLARVFEEVKGRPRHVVAESLIPRPVGKTKAKVVKSAG